MARVPYSDGSTRTALVATLWLALSAAAHCAENFTVRLATVPIDPATSANVKGSGAATAVLDGSKLSISGTYAGLRAPATVARLHNGPITGVRGPAIAEFAMPSAPDGAFAFELTLSSDHMRNLQDGKLYLQISSELAPEGNLWGWLLREAAYNSTQRSRP